MIDTTTADVADRAASLASTAATGKVLVLAGDDDRDTSAHCRVLLDALHGLVGEAVVVGPCATGYGADARAIGRIDLDCGGNWHGPLAEAGDAWKLARVIEAERPGVVHAIGARPAVLAGLALRVTRAERAVVHLPHLSALDPQPGGLSWPYRHLALRLLASLLRRPDSFLLVEREDDLGDLRQRGIDPGPRFALLGGAGIDPDVYPVLPPSQSEMPVAAFVGPLDASSGLQELLQAFERLWARGLRLQLELHGERAPDNGSGALPVDWDRLSLHPGVRCSGRPSDTREIWRHAEIFVWPAHARQGLPRPLLEAAACGRALVVSDAAGGSAFVRHEVEGLVVPALDAGALGAALERLARDAGLRQRMGAAARLRVLHGYTEAHVQEVLRGAYLSLLSRGRAG